MSANAVFGVYVRRIAVGLVVCVFMGSLLLASRGAEAIEDAPWLNAAQLPEVTAGDAIDNTEYQRLASARRGYSAGLTCFEKRVAIRRVVSVNIGYHEGCWYQTKLGLLEKEGRYLLEPGTTIAGRIKGNLLDTSLLHPTPNPNVFLELIEDAGTGYGNYVNFRTLETAAFDHAVSANGAITLSYRHTAGIPRLRSSSGNSTNVQSTEVWYSQNGQWMLVATNDGVVHRINLETFSALSIKFRDKPQGAQLPITADVTNDGRYIAASVSGQPRSELFLIDTHQCKGAEVPVSATVTATCSSRQLKSVLQTKMSNYHSIVLPRFYGNDRLGIYHREADGYRQYILQAPGTVANSWDYIALGDSFASGEGAFDYMDGTDVSNNKCHTSLRSYPYLIEREVNLTSFRSVACSGARIEHVTSTPKQKDTDNVYSTLHPGVAKQIDQLKPNLLSDERPDVVTISISGNDIGFSNRIRYCVLQNANCFATYEDRQEIIKEINQQYERLTGDNGIYTNLKDAAAPGARIYVVGYPDIVYEGDDEACGVNVRLNRYQRTMAQELIEYFNAVIRNAAHDAGVHYVDIEDALNGHRLCEAASAATAVNGVTAGDDKLLVIGSESYHPNQLGHQLMQKAILQQTEYFTKTTTTLPAIKKGLPDAQSFAFSEGVRSGRTVVNPFYVGDDRIPIYYQHGTIGFELGGLVDISTPTLPLSQYQVTLHSDPAYLGMVTSDELGTIKGEFIVPPSIEPGMHTLHITGNGVGGPIDLYKQVYIGVSDSDFDGDGILDEAEPCGIVEPSNQDTDGDGVDDGCDPVIGAARVIHEEQVSQETNATDEPASLLGVTALLPSSVTPTSIFSPIASNTSMTPAHAHEYAVTGQGALRPDSILRITATRPHAMPERQNWLPSGLAIFFTLITLLLYAKTKRRKDYG